MTLDRQPPSSVLSRELTERMERAADQLMRDGLGKVTNVEVMIYLSDGTTRYVKRPEGQ